MDWVHRMNGSKIFCSNEEYTRDLRYYGILRGVVWLLPTFRENVSVPSSRLKSPNPFILGLLTREDGTDTLSRNVCKQLRHDAA
jgi:hypothetical protein